VNSVPIGTPKELVPKVFVIGSFGSVPVFTESTEQAGNIMFNINFDSNFT
jgi:hypothetical protein